MKQAAKNLEFEKATDNVTSWKNCARACCFRRCEHQRMRQSQSVAASITKTRNF